MRVMASTLFHPQINFGGGSTPTSSNSSSTTSSSIHLPPPPMSMPNGLPSGLSVTITPAAPPSNTSVNSSTSNSSQSLGSLTITKSNGQIAVNDILDQSSCSSSPSSPSPSLNDTSCRSQDTITTTRQQQQQQQQQLRALAASLQTMTTNLHLNNHVNNSNTTTTSSSPALNQASLAAAASKLMELNPMDDILMQEVSQRLFKMNQDLWQQAAGCGTPGTTTVSNLGNHSPGSSSGPIVQSTQQQCNNDGGGIHQVNDMKIAEKLVNELAVQQSTRNAFHLNDRTLQDCWNTLQRVSCMIFMHKSAMQLQQQQQQQQQAAAHAVHHVGNPNQHGLNRSGSLSPGGASESGAPKPHQCHQCLKSFSSNHQLVQHLRVHTGEKPYKCSYCERRFKQLSHVQQHTRLHTGERPYKCHVQECGRAFIQLSNLQQHLRNHDAQLERSKNRPFHCNICGKGFATESSLRTHTTKVCKDQHAALIGGPNAVTCPICHKLFSGGEALMEHMKHTHKDPNASGVATKRRTANHPCPICGKHYVNEGSLRKHMTCHPEAAQLTSSLRMWPCSVCQAVFTHENGLLTHMDQMRTDPKHQFAAQYVLSRVAAESRERENILTAATVAAMAGNHPFGPSFHGQTMPPTSMSSFVPMMPPSPSGSESSGRLSPPLETNPGLSSSTSILQQHTRLSSPTTRPHDARTYTGNTNNDEMSGSGATTTNHQNVDTGPGNNSPAAQSIGRKEYGNLERYESYEKSSPSRTIHPNLHLENNMSGINRDRHPIVNYAGGSSNSHSHHHSIENGPFSNKFQAAEQAAMKMAAFLGQSHGQSHPGFSQNDLRNFIQHQANSQLHSQDMMSKLKAEALLRSQAAEAFRIATTSNIDRANNGPVPNINNNTNGNPIIDNHSDHLRLSLAQQQDILRGNSIQNGLSNSMHHASLNHQLNSILSQQQDLPDSILRQLGDSRNLPHPLSTPNS